MLQLKQVFMMVMFLSQNLSCGSIIYKTNTNYLPANISQGKIRILATQ